MDGLLNAMNLVHKMPVHIIQFAVALQIWFVRCGICNIIDFTAVLDCNKNNNNKYNNNKYISSYCFSVTVCPS